MRRLLAALLFVAAAPATAAPPHAVFFNHSFAVLDAETAEWFDFVSPPASPDRFPSG